MRSKLAALGLTCFLVAACKQAAPVAASSSLRDDGAGPAADECGGEAMKKRRKETFERTVDCGADAASAGIADKLKTGLQIVKEGKGIIDAIRRVATRTRGTAPASAKAALCLMTVTNYATEEALKDAFKAAANSLGNTDELWEEMVKDGTSSMTLGMSELLTKLDKAFDEPNAENVHAALVAVVDGASKLGTFATSCGPVFTTLGETVGITSLFDKTKKLGALGPIASIGKCLGTIVGNFQDVSKEWSCFEKDMEYIAEQKKAIQRALAFEGTRLFNRARWHGCNCINSSFWDSAETELNKCRSCCGDPAWVPVGAALLPKTANAFTEECKVSCGIAYTQGIFTNYTDDKSCNDVKDKTNRAPTRVHFRYILLSGDYRVATTKEMAEAKRGELVEALKTMKARYNDLDADKNGFVGRAEVQSCATSQADAALKAACRSFHNPENPRSTTVFLNFLDTATASRTDRLQPDNMDNNIGTTDFDFMIEELTQFISEAER